MKYLRFIPIVTIMLLVSCAKNSFDTDVDLAEGEGLLQVGLSVDESLQIVTKTEEAEEADVLNPSVDDFYVELYRLVQTSSEDAEWKRVHFGTYSELFESEAQEEDEVVTVEEGADEGADKAPAERNFKPIKVNAGQWKLLAFHGDSTACGFDKPYFLAEEEFIVNGGLNQEGNPNITYVDAQAKVSNARITVEFDETVPGSFYDYFVRFTNLDMVDEEGKPNKYKQILRYKKGQVKDAYMMPSQNLQVEFMAQYEYGDESTWKFANLGTVAVNPNDHLTLRISVNPRNGGLDVSITTDENIVKKDTEVEILEMWAPQNPPQIVPAGFTDGDHAVVEGDKTGNNATLSVLARAGLKNFFIKLESDYLAQAGFDLPIGEDIDIANPTSDTQEKLNKLMAAGFDWDDEMLGSRKLTYLTMTKLFERINELNPSLAVKRNLFTLTVKVVDDVDNETTKVFTSTAYPIVQTLSIDEGNVWARKIVSPKLKVERGVNSLYVLQMSKDGVKWNDFKTFEKADNFVLDYGIISADPSTTYHFRVRYNNNDNLVSNTVKVTTESLQQVGNPGFEEYHIEKQTVKITWTTVKYDREWYLPYRSYDTDPWWAVNSKKTMPGEHTAAYWEFKNFPCTAYSTDRHSGEKSAMVYTVNVNGANTSGTSLGSNIPGEIWIGRADDSGNHASDGHSFASRPSLLKFWYTYVSYNSETFVVTCILKDAQGNEIARAEKTDGGAAGEWTFCEMPIVYSNLESKAASIYISFKSCESGSINVNSTMEIAGIQQTSHLGSTLRIDDIELIY